METTAVQKLENLLLVSVPQDMTDEDVILLRRQVLQKIRQHGSRWVLLDFALVDICDSFFGRFIYSMAEMVKLMGAKVIISGLQDAVVETLIDLGLTLPHIPAVLDLDDALALARSTDATSFGAMASIRENVVWDTPEAKLLANRSEV
ncbi:STAS domain-containing protein [Anaerolineales bacterium HSG6]|nr:STAS domain-containing protein [Anaerolineales bacterium HSG6]MDM8532321.1 STAS domain-containing protein [Anaerolineales bacterium HSG25]